MNMKDIAALAGVSKATVSRVVNNPSQVTPALREKVQRIIEETGYEPNLLARELVTKKTNLIGVMLPRIGVDTFSEITEGIIETLDSEGYNVLLSRARDGKDDEIKYLDIFTKKYVDGVIIFATHMNNPLINALNRIKVPLVVIGQRDSRINASTVVYDDYKAAKDIVSYLAGENHKDIAYIGLGNTTSNIGRSREDGYLGGLKQLGLPIKNELMVDGDFTVASGYEAMAKIMMANEEKPTAVFAAIDRLAFGAMRYLQDKGYRVPQDIAVIGIDNMDISAMVTPTLSSMDFNYRQSGVEAATLLLHKLKLGTLSNEHVIMGYELMERNSTKSNKA